MAYTPTQPGFEGQDSDAFKQWCVEEFRRIAVELNGVTLVQLPELDVEPSKRRDGMVVLADGTNWNPGSGAGYYGYQDGSWTFLG